MTLFATAGTLLVQLLLFLLNLYTWIIIFSALLSWMPLPPTSKFVRFIRFLTEPVLGPCRQLLYRILPRNWQIFDFSPLLALLLIQLVIRLIVFLVG